MKEVTKRRAVYIIMLLLVVFAMTAFVACGNKDGDEGEKGKPIGLTIEYTEKTWYDGDVFEVPSYTTEAEGATVSVSYTIDGGSEILALVGSTIDLYAGEYVFTYKATLAGYTPEEKSISFTVEEAGEDPTQTVAIDGFTGPVYEADVFAMSEFTVPTGSVSEGSTLKITMTDPQGVAKTVSGGDKVAINHSGAYTFTYEAVHSDPSYKNKKIDLTVKSAYKGLVGDFENFAISPDVAVTGYVSVQNDIKHDGESALRLRTSGNDKFPRNRPQAEQVNYSSGSKFGTVAADANTVSFWIYPTTDDVLLLSLGFCHPDNWLEWHKDKEFKNNALLIGSLTPNEWHYVSLPLPEQFTSEVFEFGLTHFGVFVLADKNYNTYYNYRDLFEIGGDAVWKDDDGNEIKNNNDFWTKGPQEEVLTYIDSVCFTNDPDWNCDQAFKTVKPTVTKQYQTHRVDYLSQIGARISVSYKVGDGEEITVDDDNQPITRGSKITLAESGTYTFTYTVLDRTDDTPVYSTTQTFAIEAVSNAIMIEGYEGTDYTDTKDALSKFTVPVGTAQQQGATVTVKMTDPKGTQTDVEGGDEITLDWSGTYTFVYEAELDGTTLGSKTLTITSNYVGLVNDFENFTVGGDVNATYVAVSSEQKHDGEKSLKFVTKKSSDPSQNGWPWNRPRLEQWNGTQFKAGENVNTVSFWLYPTTNHALLLNLGFKNGNNKHALYIGKLPPNQWHYVSLPLPTEITSNMNSEIWHLGIYVLDDKVTYNCYYNYQDETGICNEGAGPNMGPDAKVAVYIDTLCFTNDPNWNCDKAIKFVSPVGAVQCDTYTVDYTAQSGSNITISYTVNGGDAITTDDSDEAIAKGSVITLNTAGTYVFTYTATAADGTTVTAQVTQEFTVASRLVSIVGYENKPYSAYKAFGEFVVPAGSTADKDASISIKMTTPSNSEARDVTAGTQMELSETGDYTFIYEVTKDEQTIGSNTLTIHAYKGLVTDFENGINIGGDPYDKFVFVSTEQKHSGDKSLKFVTKKSTESGWPWNRPRVENAGLSIPAKNANTVSFWVYPTTNHALLLNLGFTGGKDSERLKHALYIGKLTPNKWHHVSLRLPDNIMAYLDANINHLGIYVLDDKVKYNEPYNNQNETGICNEGKGPNMGPNENVVVYIDDLSFTIEEYND